MEIDRCGKKPKRVDAERERYRERECPRSKWYNLWNWLVLIKKFLTRPKIDAMELPGENKTIAGFNLIWMFDKSDLLLSLFQS